MRKAFLAAGMALVMSGAAAWADTPIGPGVTGVGGTGADAADAKLKAGAGGEARVLRQDGMPADGANANVSGDKPTSMERRNKADAEGRAPLGATDSTDASGRAKSEGAVQ